jgi:multiple sugar transport system substrate-binding protein
MTEPVTWDQIIDAASDNGGTVGVQANRYEGYIVWLNALIQGAGGEIVSDVEAGSDLQIDLDSEPAREAARIVEKLAGSPAAESDLSVSNEGTVLGPFAGDRGAFQVNWTFISTNYAGSATADDLGWARYPQTIAGQESKPPIGGINIGVSKYGGDTEAAYDAVACITSEANQVAYAIGSGNMPARDAAYDSAELNEAFPADLLQSFRDSIDSAGPRPATPYWGTIVNAMLGRWHPAASVSQDTPASSAKFVRDVLAGDALN